MKHAYPENAVPVSMVEGDDWDEVRANARRIACMPHGEVMMDQNYTGGLIKKYYGKDDTGPRKKYYAYVVVVPGKAPKLRVEPEPVKGAEYYSLDDIARALGDLNYYGAGQIVTKLRQRLSVRDDGRFTLDEIKRAGRDVQGGYGIGGTSVEDFLDKTALQVRKNRVFDAYGGE